VSVFAEHLIRLDLVCEQRSLHSDDIENRFDCRIVAHKRSEHRDRHPDNQLELIAEDHLVIVADLPSLNSLTNSNEGRGE
jgi:Trk K+ transport system NAD-binding subunit